MQPGMIRAGSPELQLAQSVCAIAAEGYAPQKPASASSAAPVLRKVTKSLHNWKEFPELYYILGDGRCKDGLSRFREPALSMSRDAPCPLPVSLRETP